RDLADIAGLNWWTSLQADEDSVRFVGKLYRHYAIEGKTEMLTRDPLFLTHVRNPDFDDGTEGWTVRAAEAGASRPRGSPGTAGPRGATRETASRSATPSCG